jgi:uncharacterized membrane protein
MSRVKITNEELEVLQSLRNHRKLHRQKVILKANPEKQSLTLGQVISDGVAKTVGSWTFIIIQSLCIIAWIIFNTHNGSSAWDAYPFILLNLVLSFQAAYTAPAIMMSQNRQSEIDRQQAHDDFEINVKAELEIEMLHQKIDLMKEQEFLFLTEAIKELSIKIDRYQPS